MPTCEYCFRSYRDRSGKYPAHYVNCKVRKIIELGDLRFNAGHIAEDLFPKGYRDNPIAQLIIKIAKLSKETNKQI